MKKLILAAAVMVSASAMAQASLPGNDTAVIKPEPWKAAKQSTQNQDRHPPGQRFPQTQTVIHEGQDMNINQLIVMIAALMGAYTAQAGDLSHAVAKVKLEKILTCKKGASPEEVISLLKTLHGRSIVQVSSLDAEYTVPNPVELFGRPVTKISIHHGMNADGDFNEYGALFSGESIGAVAKIAGIVPDAAGIYRKEVGGHDLILRLEAGATYIICANDVRTIVKTIKRTVKNVSKVIADAAKKEEDHR